MDLWPTSHSYIPLWLYLGKCHHDLTERAKPIDDGFDRGKSSPFMAELFMLVNYSTGWWFETFYMIPYIGNNHPK